MPKQGGDRLDRFARRLAGGRSRRDEDGVSRRDALRRFGGVMIGGAAGAAVVADPAEAAPPTKCAKGQTSCCNATCGTVCVTISSDIHNCGGCGKACSPPANSSATCVGGSCGFTCNTGFITCNGACVNTTNDSNNCGSCGNACPSGQTCSNSTCSTPSFPNGTPCTSDSQCSSGYCVTDNANPNASVCNATSCTAQASTSCGYNGNALSDGSGCAYWPYGTACDQCTSLIQFTACDGSGQCLVGPMGSC